MEYTALTPAGPLVFSRPAASSLAHLISGRHTEVIMRSLARSSFIAAITIGPAQQACSDDFVGGVTGEIEVKCCAPSFDQSDSLVDFGDVQVGILMTREIQVKNTGSGVLRVTGVEFGPEFMSG